MVPINSETLCLSEATEVINEISVNLPLQLLAQENYIFKISSSFDENFEQISTNRIIEVAKLKPEPTFQNTINEIKDNHFKSITSITMNISAIASNKTYSSSEHLQEDLMKGILIQ